MYKCIYKDVSIHDKADEAVRDGASDAGGDVKGCFTINR